VFGIRRAGALARLPTSGRGRNIPSGMGCAPYDGSKSILNLYNYFKTQLTTIAFPSIKNFSITLNANMLTAPVFTDIQTQTRDAGIMINHECTNCTLQPSCLAEDVKLLKQGRHGGLV